MILAHTDTHHAHIHIVVNRVHPDDRPRRQARQFKAVPVPLGASL